jgi:hypothetical protein
MQRRYFLIPDYFSTTIVSTVDTIYLTVVVSDHVVVVLLRDDSSDMYVPSGCDKSPSGISGERTPSLHRHRKCLSDDIPKGAFYLFLSV